MADQSGSQGLGVDGMASEDDLHNHGVGMDAMGSDEDLGLCPKPRVHVEKRLKKTANDIEAGKVKKDRDDWGDGALAGGYEEKYRPSSSAMSDQSTGAPNHAPMVGVQRAPIERNDGAQPRLVTTATGSDNPLASSNPSGINGLQSSAPPPFLNKTYDMVDDASTDAVVSWSAANNTFVVWNPAEFASDLLPKYFKHNNFSSFVRQLNTYGFRKVDPDRWEFANDGFLRGQRHLLKNIHRRKPVSHHHPPPQQQQTQSTPPGPFEDAGLEAEVRKLRTDKNVLMVELVRLQKQQLVTEQEMEVMNERLQLTEQRQQQMMSFLAKAMQSTTFLAQLVQQNENNKRIDTDRKRRRLPKQEIGGDSGAPGFDGQIVKYQPTTNEAARAMMLFLDNNEVSSPIEPGGQLEALITDLVSAPIGQVQDSDMANHYSGVTLTEMQVSPTSIDETLTEPSLQDDPTVLEVRDVDRIDREASIVSHPNSTESTGDVHVPFIHSSVGGQGLIGQDGESSAESKPTSGTSGQNDVFWQQFLTGNPESPSNESDDTETTDGMVQQVDEDKSSWFSSKPSVDRLAEKMGQLAPGIRL